MSWFQAAVEAAGGGGEVAGRRAGKHLGDAELRDRAQDDAGVEAENPGEVCAGAVADDGGGRRRDIPAVGGASTAV